MMKRMFAVLCILALLCQPMAMAEDITTPSDLPLYCEACGGEAKLTYTVDTDGSHVAMCLHGVVDETTRHEGNPVECVSVSDTRHDWLCHCGIVIYEDPHQDSCTNPGVCAVCGATGVTLAWQNHNCGDYEHDETKHWQTCQDCGEIIYEDPHRDSCTNPGVCAVCGATGVTMAWQDHNCGDYEHDETKHWQTCQDCGEIIYETPHQDSCTNPGVCVVCGATGVTMAWQNHDWGDYEHDETKHWQTCQDCGEISGAYNHGADCGTPDVCLICGATGVTMAWQNHDWGDYEHDETKHWKTCQDCGEIYEDPHQDSCTNPGVCAACGATGVTMAWQNHDWGDYEHDETKHWQTCQDCGEISASNHVADCDTPDVCFICGATGVTMARQNHYYDWENPKHDNARHWYACQDCGQVTSKDVHRDICTNPGVCVDCGATGVTMAQHDHNFDWENPPQHDSSGHWWVCQSCGKVDSKEAHYDVCTNPGVCAACGETGVAMAWREHRYDGNDPQHDATKHWWVCMDCGEIVDACPHLDSCMSRDGICDECGASFSTGNYEHWNDHDELMADAEKHWWVCGACGEVNGEGTHFMLCSDTTTGVCYWCGEPCTQVMHEPLGDVQHDADQHWWVCESCNQIVDKAAHVPSKDDPTKCEVCGADIVQPTEEPTVEPTVAPTAEPTAEPTAAPTAEPTVEPTAEPTTEPTAAPTEKPTTKPTNKPTPIPLPTVTAAPVHEHTYDAAFVSNGDGTHSKTCLAEDCDETITEPCTLVTTDMGLMVCTACAKCGYAVYTAKAGIAALTEGEDVPAVITRVETASIAPADEAAEPVVPADTALVVHETVFEVPVSLSEEIQGAVEKVFTAALIKDGESIQPAGQVKLRIPVDEETAATLEGKVLMLLREDGTLVEVPFEVIDGEIVFLTEEVGVFLLMTPEEVAKD